MATTVVVKNNTVANQWLSDFGIVLAASGQITLSDVADLDEIYSSADLKTKVTNDIFIINNGQQDLAKADALKYIDFTTDYELDTTALSGVDLTYLETAIEALSADHPKVSKNEMAMIIALGGF
jgi:hypothetical protein